MRPSLSSSHPAPPPPAPAPAVQQDLARLHHRCLETHGGCCRLRSRFNAVVATRKQSFTNENAASLKETEQRHKNVQTPAHSCPTRPLPVHIPVHNPVHILAHSCAQSCAHSCVHIPVHIPVQNPVHIPVCTFLCTFLCTILCTLTDIHRSTFTHAVHTGLLDGWTHWRAHSVNPCTFKNNAHTRTHTQMLHCAGEQGAGGGLIDGCAPLLQIISYISQ